MLIVLLAALAAPIQPGAAPAAAPQAEARVCTPEQWAEDLDQLAEELPAKHKNLFHRTTKEEWAKRIEALRPRLAGLEETRAALEFSRIAAIADAHTHVDVSPLLQGRPVLPVGLTPVKEGYALAAAPEEQRELLGSILTAIEGMPVEKAGELAAEYFPWENRAGRTNTLAKCLCLPDALEAAGVIASRESVTLTFKTAEGAERAITVRPVAPGELRAMKTAQLEPAPAGLAAVSRIRRKEAMWCEKIPERPMLYVRYNRCQNDADATVASYIEGVLKTLDDSKATRVIVDLRYNGGGDSSLIAPLLRGLGEREAFKVRGSVLVLTGLRTFSSAEMGASALRKRCGGVVIGGPTGQKPNTYGEMKSFTLRNTRLKVTYSVKFFRTEEGDPESLMPDVPVETTAADLMAGRDPVLEAAAAYDAAVSPGPK